MLKIGLIGLGFHGVKAVLPSIVDNAHWKLTAIADNDPSRLDQVNLTGIQRFTDANAMIEQADLDAVYVATLLETHAPLTIAALKAGRHVVCEKPMAPSADLCRQMVQAADQTGKILVVNFETRFMQHNGIMRQWVQEGLIGELQALHLQNLWDGHKTGDRRRRLIDRAGGLDCGIHKLDMVRFLAGGGQWTHIQAMGTWLGETVTYPPHISVLGQLDGRIMATVNASVAYGASVPSRPSTESAALVGTGGVISYFVDESRPNSEAQVSCHHKNGVIKMPIDHTSHVSDISLLLDELHACIQDPARLKTSILPTGHDGLQAQIAVEWALEKVGKLATAAS